LKVTQRHWQITQSTIIELQKGGRILAKPQLGIIEGFFGRSWGWHEREQVVDYLAPAGYRFYHYAPKIDAKLRKNWAVLHDDTEITAIASFAAHCREGRMRFGIGLTPYGAHLDFNAETRTQLKAKLANLDAMGIDDLAILFDDMRGDFADLAQRQADIVAFCLDHSKATRFFMCPSYYSNDPLLDRVFGQRPENYLAELGRLIDREIAIYWTGEEVCSREYSSGHLHDISDQLGRPIALWDNYPVNDGPRMSNHLHLRAFTGRPHRVGKYVSHHAINPASQPLLGCIPALTLPMRYARGSAYCYGSAFREAAEKIAGPELASLLEKDMLSFQDSGLLLIADRIETIRARYAAIDSPVAREVIDWLDGGYAITGEMLHTQ
jgi:hyaluronoglucosaminidase